MHTPTEIDLEAQTRLVQALVRTLEPAEGGPIRLVQTHVSWVLIGPRTVWKLRKALCNDFLDWRQRSARVHDAREELRLNRRLAPALYLGLSWIGGTTEQPQCRDAAMTEAPDATVLDVAVRMRAFDEAQQWDRRIDHGQLDADAVCALARTLARFQRDADVAPPDGPWGHEPEIRAPVIDCLDVLARLMPGEAAQARIARLRRWEAQTATRLGPWWPQRLAQAQVREGHGDLHLGNITEIDGAAVPFDCLEFDPALRWIDTGADLAFLLMDLRAHGRADLAGQALAAWLEATGDVDALPGLRYAQVARALVRAKVHALRERQSGLAVDGQQGREALALAETLSRPPPLRMVITHGLSGSGKTRRSARALLDGETVRWRADVERKRLAGLPALQRSGSAPGQGLYSPQRTAQTYAHLLQLADATLAAGHPVVLDATFLHRADRDAAQAVAQRHGLDCQILVCDAPPQVLQERLLRRAALGGDASDADASVLAAQRAQCEPLGPDEQQRAFDDGAH